MYTVSQYIRDHQEDEGFLVLWQAFQPDFQRLLTEFKELGMDPAEAEHMAIAHFEHAAEDEREKWLLGEAENRKIDEFIVSLEDVIHELNLDVDEIMSLVDEIEEDEA